MYTISMDFEDNQHSSKHKTKANRKILKDTRHPVYRGERRKNGGKWVGEGNMKSTRGENVAALVPHVEYSSSHQADVQRADVDFIPSSSLAVSGGGSGVVVGFVDEEAVFNMPALLDSMAEGMLLTPLAMKKGFNWSQCEVDDDGGLEFNLWTN